jgi:uncharacterized protein YggU (UPF0235/DUF167 family)
MAGRRGGGDVGEEPIIEVAGGVLIAVRVRPRSRPGVRAVDGSVVVGVASAPVEGKATEEARRALAVALNLPRSAVLLHRGAASRQKVFLALGVTASEAVSRLGLGAGRDGRPDP